MKNDGRQEHILVFDDISDSFDYKNKYAIFEYLCDLKNDERFKMLILTHNFDFYRTIYSRLCVKRNSIYMTYKDTEGEIKFHSAEYLEKPFMFIKNNADKPAFFIALIPLARNLIEYTKNISEGTPAYSDYLILTSSLHVKTETESITVDVVKKIITKNMEVKNLPTVNTNLAIKDFIYETAENLSNEPNLDEISIVNKIVFATAIRLMAEEYMISKLKKKMSDDEFGVFYKGIKTGQTNVLTKEFEKRCCPTDDIQLLIKEVNLITPENIHINSFMIEPLIDMSVWRLKQLYQDTKKHIENNDS